MTRGQRRGYRCGIMSQDGQDICLYHRKLIKKSNKEINDVQDPLLHIERCEEFSRFVQSKLKVENVKKINIKS